jgi:hypothetical protein
VNFKDFFSPSLKQPVQKRHMHPIGRDVSSHPQTPGKFVPDMHQTKHTNQKVTLLKNKQSGKITLTNKDVQQIEKEFAPLKFDPNKPKKLGNTGIIIKFDININKPVLEK